MKKVILLTLAVLLLGVCQGLAADTKISALPAITTVDSANDVIPIVDVTATATTKKITPNQIVAAVTKTYCKTITNPSDADSLLFMIMPAAFVPTKITGIAVGGTSAVVDIQECTTAGASCANIQTASLTVDTDGANTTSFSDASVASGAVMKIDVGTVTGVVTQVMVCMEGN